MSQKPVIGQTEDGASSEETVLRYLEQQPEFFVRHPELLTHLSLKHDVGGAVSLIEHQVQALRARNQQLSSQLSELIAVARENDVLMARLHLFASALIGAHTADEVIEAAIDTLRREFRIDAITLRLLREPAGSRPEYVGVTDRRLRELFKRFDRNKPILDAGGDESLRRYLFEKQWADIRALALVPLGGPTPEGVLALGAHEASRFHAGMGTVYLTRLGELLSRALATSAA
jgi:uncharacterized protein YigA (DUF484 family)